MYTVRPPNLSQNNKANLTNYNFKIMRGSVFSILTSTTTVVAILLFTGDDFGVAAHSHDLSPFVRNEVRRSASSTTITSMVPRGGAALAQKQDSVVSVVLPSFKSSSTRTGLSVDLPSSQKSSRWLRGGAKDLIPREKRGWAVALGLSVIYLLLLLTKKTNSCNYSSDGFCVTNFDKATGECPGPNSHRWAWNIDVVFTILAVVIGLMKKAAPLEVVAIGAVIGVHGVLHWVFDHYQCAFPVGNGGGLTLGLTLGYLAYAGFTALLSYVCFNFADVGSVALNVIGTLIVTFATVYLTHVGYSTSPIFMTTQLLVSLVGFNVKPGNNNTFSARMGTLFALPCAVSIFELLFCCNGADPGFFNKIGGHVWYDFFLHIAILSTFFPDKLKTEY